MRRRSQVEIDPPERHRRSTLGWCWYSGAKSWPELLTWAYSPPMGLYRTAIVQGLSSAHGPEQRRKNRQSFWTFNAVTLKDNHPRLASFGERRRQAHRHRKCSHTRALLTPKAVRRSPQDWGQSLGMCSLRDRYIDRYTSTSGPQRSPRSLSSSG